MRPQQRIRACRLIEKANRNRKLAVELGIFDKSKFSKKMELLKNNDLSLENRKIP